MAASCTVKRQSMQKLMIYLWIKVFKNALLIDCCDKISEVNFTSVYTLVIYYINVCGNKLLNCKCVKKGSVYLKKN